MSLVGVLIREYLMIVVAEKRNPREMLVHSWGHRRPDSLPYWPHPQKVQAVMMGGSQCSAARLLGFSQVTRVRLRLQVTRGAGGGSGGERGAACRPASGALVPGSWGHPDCWYPGRHCLLGRRWMTSPLGPSLSISRPRTLRGWKGP